MTTITPRRITGPYRPSERWPQPSRSVWDAEPRRQVADARAAAVSAACGDSVVRVNQVKNRLQSLGLVDRAFAATTDDELSTAIDAMDDEHRDAVEELLGGSVDTAAVRDAVAKGRMDGTMESLALVVTDSCLADCIEELGEHADHPSSDELREALPGLVEGHGVGITRLMLASTVAGEAPAAAIIRDLLKNDDLVKLPPAETRTATPRRSQSSADAEERAALKARRKEERKRKQAEARARREQSQRDRTR
jgi:hypothetical protein